MKLDRRSSACL